MKPPKWRWIEIEFNSPIETVPLTIISDAAVATQAVGDGRLIPVLLVDTSSRPDIESLVRAHKDFAPGDATSIWGKFSKKQKTIHLVLHFERPSECIAILEFDILKQGGIVDQIMSSEAVYLQCAREGERFSGTLGRGAILVEVPSKQVRDKWNSMLLKALEADGKRQGLGKGKAKEFSKGAIEEWRRFGEMRKK